MVERIFFPITVVISMVTEYITYYKTRYGMSVFWLIVAVLMIVVSFWAATENIFTIPKGHLLIAAGLTYGLGMLMTHQDLDELTYRCSLIPGWFAVGCVVKFVIG